MLFIIIPVHNRWHFTKDCLIALSKQTYKGFQTIVVDDGSTDETAVMIPQHFPDVIVLKGNGNLWWTGATNLGIKYAQSQNASYVLTLNNDTIPQRDYLEKMMLWAERKPNSLFGSLGINTKTKQLDYGGERMMWWREQSYLILQKLKKSELQGIHDVTHYPGRGLLIPTTVFTSIGLFDFENFPHYFADYDFTLRARKAGYDVYCNYDARLETYPDESGEMEIKRIKSFKNYKQHLFGMKGGGNLPLFLKFAFRHCPPFALPVYVSLGITRRLFGYWLN